MFGGDSFLGASASPSRSDQGAAGFAEGDDAHRRGVRGPARRRLRGGSGAGDGSDCVTKLSCADGYAEVSISQNLLKSLEVGLPLQE